MIFVRVKLKYFETCDDQLAAHKTYSKENTWHKTFPKTANHGIYES